MLFFAPNGRIARGVGWGFAALSRYDWYSIHTAFAAIFVIAGLVHIARHWSAIVNYVTGFGGSHRKLGREAIAAIVITIALLTAIIVQLPPLTYITDLHHYFRTQYWGEAPNHERRNFGRGWRHSR